MPNSTPQWFSSDFPDLAARRESFPSVERYQSAYVRYGQAEEAQAQSWDAETCRRSMLENGLDPAQLGRGNLPDKMSLRIIDAPAEFALPVKQDRRLFPCFKLRLEASHRGSFSLPLTLRAHVLTQQDKEHITSWVPPDDASSVDDKGQQKAGTELKGLFLIKHVWEPNPRPPMYAHDLRKYNGGTSLAATSASAAPGVRGPDSIVDRAVKAEPCSSFNGLGPTASLNSSAAAFGSSQLGPSAPATASTNGGTNTQQQQQHMMDTFALVDSPSLNNGGLGNGMLQAAGSVRDMGAVNAAHLFGGNRPDPVVTLASSGAHMTGLGGGSNSLSRDSLEAVMESLINTPLQGGQAGLESSDVTSSKLVSHMRQLQAQQQAQLAAEQQAQMQAAQLQAQQQAATAQAQQQSEAQERRPSVAQGTAHNEPTTYVSYQDYEFTNLEFLKPTRMNKVFMVFTVSMGNLEDLLYVTFNVPTIGICRAEQREKACKKLNIDFKLLSHFDHAGNNGGADHMAKAMAMRNGSTTVGGVGAMHHTLNAPAGLSMSRLNGTGSGGSGDGNGSGSASGEAKAQQHQLSEATAASQYGGQQQLQVQMPGMKMASLQDMKLQQHHQQQQLSDVNFPHYAGMDMQQQQHQQHQQQHQHFQQHQQPRLSGMGSGLGGGMNGGNGMSGGNGMNGSMGMAGSMGAGAEFFLSANNGGLQAQGSGPGMAGMGSMGGGMGSMGGGAVGGPFNSAMELSLAGMGGSRKRDQGPKEDENCRFQPVQQGELPPYHGFSGLTSSDVEMLLPAPHSRMAMRDFINEVYDSTGLIRKLTHMDMQALLSQAGFPNESSREHDTISQQQWDEFCVQFRNIVGTLQQVASVWNMEDPVVISGFDMDRAGTVNALVNEPAGTFICRFSMSQPGCLVLTCKVGPGHPRADTMGLIHAIIKIDDLNERRVDTWIRDYAGATHLLDVYRCKRVDKRKVFATNYTRLRGLEVGEALPFGMTPGFM